MKHAKHSLHRTLSYLSRRRTLLLLSLLSALAVTLLSLSLPLLIGRAIDTMIEAGGVAFGTLTIDLIEIALVALTLTLLQILMRAVNNRLTWETVHDLREDAFAKLRHLPISYLDHHPTGEIVSRIISDTEHFAEGLLMGISHFVVGLLTVLGTAVVMLAIHPVTALLVLVLTPLSLLIAHLIARRTHRMFDEQARVRGEQTAFIEEMIAGQKLIHSFGTEGQTMQAFDATNRRLRRTSAKATFFSSLTSPATHFVHHMVLALICLTGPLAVISGYLTVGGLIGLVSYAEQYGEPLNEISGIVTEIQHAIACADRIFELLDQPESVSDEGNAVLPTPSGRIEADHIRFAYEDDGVERIHDLSISVKAGQHIAIVGPTGCGKTTLVNLLMRFYDVDSGSITVDGMDVRDVTRHSLRSGIGMVLQETWLRHGTIRENLVFGKPDATDAQIRNAAALCHADSFILRLPDGYDTVISEGGTELSAGQRQLICIARVLLADPEILILDEATSMLDTRTEGKIRHALDRLMKGRTSFIATHRLSTVHRADRILVMQDGCVVEQGTHEELLALGGTYHTLYHTGFDD